MKIEEILKGKGQVESLSILCKLFGSKRDGGMCLGTEGLNIVIDGRIAEEYEDLPNEAPCRVDYIGASVDGTSVWFHMYTAFSTSFPLASNDKYNIGCVGEDNIKLIYNFYYSTYKDKQVDDKQMVELVRNEWMHVKNRLLSIPTFKCDIQRLIDHGYCCHGSDGGGWGATKPDGILEFEHPSDQLLDLAGRPGSGIKMTSKKWAKETIPVAQVPADEFVSILLDCITPQVAMGIRIAWPTYSDYKNSGYLAYQTVTRYARWKRLTPMIYKRAKELCDDDRLKFVMGKMPSEILETW